jgi:hypothetical protein
MEHGGSLKDYARMKHANILRSTAVLLTGAVVIFGCDACQKAATPGQDMSLTGTATPTAVGDSAPPALPIYSQPPIPADGYIWTPGYWAWNDSVSDYFWVPGTWVQPPQTGLLWTPGYWAFLNGQYAFNQGYWGPHVGFYGGIDYGFGYGGAGYQGGHWQGDSFDYNTAVNNISQAPITHVYRQAVADNRTPSHVSFNGGAGGVSARASSDELAAARDAHIAPTSIQHQHVQLAQTRPGLRASTNLGRPAIAATSRPAMFAGKGVVTNARAAVPYRPPTVAPRSAPDNRPSAQAVRPLQSAPQMRAAIRPEPPRLPMPRQPPPHVAAAPTQKPTVAASPKTGDANRR